MADWSRVSVWIARLKLDGRSLVISVGAYMIFIALFLTPVSIMSESLSVVSIFGVPLTVLLFVAQFFLIVVLIPVALSEVVYRPRRRLLTAFLIYLVSVLIVFFAQYGSGDAFPKQSPVLQSGLIVAGMIVIWIVASYRAISSMD